VHAKPVRSLPYRSETGDNAIVDSVGDAAVRRSFGTVMSELARTLQREHASEHGTLAAVTAAAVQAVPGAENATITLVVGRTKVQTRATTGARGRRMDELQTELDDGPCLTRSGVSPEENIKLHDVAAKIVAASHAVNLSASVTPHSR